MGRVGYPSGRDGTAGSWPGNAAVVSAEFAYFCQGVYKSISETGGTYSLDSALIIGGFGVTFATVATSFYGISCSGNTTLGTNSSSLLTVNATSHFNSPVDFTDYVSIDGGSSGTHSGFGVGQYVDSVFSGLATFNKNVTFAASVFVGTTSSDLLDVLAQSGFQASATFNSNVSLSGGSSGAHVTLSIGQYYNVTFSSSNVVVFNGAGINNSGVLAQSGVTTFSSSLIRATGCHNRLRLKVVADADVSIDAGTYDRVYMTTGTSSHTAAITASGWEDGETITIFSMDSSSVHVTYGGGSLWYLHQFEWIELTWSDADAQFYATSGGTLVYHAS